MRRSSVFVDPQELLKLEGITHNIVAALVLFFDNLEHPALRTVVHVVFEPLGEKGLRIFFLSRIHGDDPDPPINKHLFQLSFSEPVIEGMKLELLVLLLKKKVASLMTVGRFCKEYSAKLDLPNNPPIQYFSLVREGR